MDVWKERECFGVVIMVALAPWEAKTLAMSIMGIWWPPPTNGKKNISTGGEFKSIVAEGMDLDESLAGKREREPSTLLYYRLLNYNCSFFYDKLYCYGRVNIAVHSKR
jgi:hypothetical protein